MANGFLSAVIRIIFLLNVFYLPIRALGIRVRSPASATTSIRQRVSRWSPLLASPTNIQSSERNTLLHANEVTQDASSYVESWSQTLSVLFEPISSTADGIVLLCDRVDESEPLYRMNAILRNKRYKALATMLKRNRDEYITVVSFLGDRIPRDELPNAQGIPIPCGISKARPGESLTREDDQLNSTPMDRSEMGSGKAESQIQTQSFTNSSLPLVGDCELPVMKYRDTVLDRFLMARFRHLVQKEIGFASETKGIRGLLEEGKHMLMSPRGQENNCENQHTYVKRVLDQMLPPMLPALFRVFMSGVLPNLPNLPTNGKGRGGNQSSASVGTGNSKWGMRLGPWFYAPYLTSVVSPLFLTFLIGPCRPNLRKDGQRGGMIVEKCKFLQESNCKGLCLHQCKLPAEQYFLDTLGLPLSVSPNFETQECQWSWGEHPLPYQQDKEFPKGCIKGCSSRLALHHTHS